MNPLELSSFSLHTEKLVEVLFRRDRGCSSRGPDVTLLCSRVVANDRFSAKSDVHEYSSIENETILDDEIYLQSDKRKLSSTVIVNGFDDSQQSFDLRPNKINEVLENIGLVCNVDKMYTLYPQEMYYHTHNITTYYQKNFIPKLCSKGEVPGKNTSERFCKSNVKNYADSKECCNKNHHKGHLLTSNNCRCVKNKKYPINYGDKIPLKYWSMRHLLFSKFDLGILLDRESFYSVCPEILSYHIAKRCENDLALDPFCGAGGNIIQLALTCKLVIAIDIDPQKIQFAKSNATIYGVADKIEFITGDFFTVSSMLKADVIFMSPPWGGPEYLCGKSFSIESMCNNKHSGGFTIFDDVKKIAPNIAFHMPKTTNIYECLWIAKDLEKVEIQQNIVNKKLNSITAFYGEFVDVTDNDY